MCLRIFDVFVWELIADDGVPLLFCRLLVRGGGHDAG